MLARMLTLSFTSHLLSCDQQLLVYVSSPALCLYFLTSALPRTVFAFLLHFNFFFNYCAVRGELQFCVTLTDFLLTFWCFITWSNIRETEKEGNDCLHKKRKTHWGHFTLRKFYMQIPVKSSEFKGEGWNAQLPLIDLSRYPVLWEVLQASRRAFTSGRYSNRLFFFFFFDLESCLLAPTHLGEDLVINWGEPPSFQQGRPSLRLLHSFHLQQLEG